MKHMTALLLAAALACGLSACAASDPAARYNGLAFLAYTDIDTVCEDGTLAAEGGRLLSGLGDHLLLSYVVDSAIDLTGELGEYDHLVLANPRWIRRFADPERLRPVELSALDGGLRDFLAAQLPVLTAGGEILPDGMALYEYQGGGLPAFPVNVTLGAARPLEAARPLIVLVDRPEVLLDPGACLLPLTSSGNILFDDGEALRAALADSPLQAYCEARTLGGG